VSLPCFFVCRCLAHHFPSLGFSFQDCGTLECPNRSLNSSNAAKLSSQSASRGSHTKPSDSSLWIRSGVSLPCLFTWRCVSHQLPSLGFSFHGRGTLQCLNCSLYAANATKLSSQAVSWVSHTKPSDSSLRTRSGVRLPCFFFRRCVVHHDPSPGSSIHARGTLQCLNCSLYAANAAKFSSQSASWGSHKKPSDSSLWTRSGVRLPCFFVWRCLCVANSYFMQQWGSEKDHCSVKSRNNC